MTRTIKLPDAVADIYRVVGRLNAEFPSRSFTPDGHLVGHLGEVIAAREFGLTLLGNSHPGHDATDSEGRYVQIKLTGGRRVALYGDCDRLIVMQIVTSETTRVATAELVYDGDGAPIWATVAHKKVPKNGQLSVSLATLRRIALAKSEA
jgi:hypothetical protein